ncbi:hypothetical protein Slin14017_G107460 [Septoria linicola]|nr:hypothetical protein Slin14017_G107460 [Septoria linicola]
MILSLLYCQPLAMDEPYHSIMLHVTNTIAYAAYHDMLPSIAAQLESFLKPLPDLWKEVSQEREFYYAIATKIRSADILQDAVRHMIGQGMSYTNLFWNKLATKAEACATLLPSQECHTKMHQHLTNRVQRILLPSYQAHASGSRKEQGPIVPTTWLDADLEPKDFAATCKNLATTILREWLDVRVYGEPHWSHIKFVRSREKKDGQIRGRSLRQACEALRIARDDKCNLEHLELEYTSSQYVKIFKLEAPKDWPYSAVATLRRELKNAVFLVARCVDKYCPKEESTTWDYCCDCYSIEPHEPAKYDSGLDYFTTMAVDSDCFPWADEKERKEWILPMRDIAESSKEWLELVGAS